jgi:hypothetical protein
MKKKCGWIGFQIAHNCLLIRRAPLGNCPMLKNPGYATESQYRFLSNAASECIEVRNRTSRLHRIETRSLRERKRLCVKKRVDRLSLDGRRHVTDFHILSLSACAHLITSNVHQLPIHSSLDWTLSEPSSVHGNCFPFEMDNGSGLSISTFF